MSENAYIYIFISLRAGCVYYIYIYTRIYRIPAPRLFRVCACVLLSAAPSLSRSPRPVISCVRDACGVCIVGPARCFLSRETRFWNSFRAGSLADGFIDARARAGAVFRNGAPRR